MLENQILQLLMHLIPEQNFSNFEITTPPERREDNVSTFFCTVPSIAAARTVAAELGGEVFAEQWAGPGFVVCNAMDPEGNVFQVREQAP